MKYPRKVTEAVDITIEQGGVVVTKRLRIGIFMNGWTSRVEGGDFHIMKVGEIWAKNNHEVFLVTLRAAAFRFGDLVSRIKLRPYDTPIERRALRGISNGIEYAFLYLVRTMVCSFQQNTYDALVASHFSSSRTR